MEWNEANSELIQRLYRDGKTAREIAAIVGGGVTRNAIIGKLNRIKRQSGGASVGVGRKKSAKKAVATSAAKKAAAVKPVAKPPTKKAVKSVAKPSAKKAAKKAAAKPVSKPVSKKVVKAAAKPAAKKTAAKAVAKPSAKKVAVKSVAKKVVKAAAKPSGKGAAGANGKASSIGSGSAVVSVPSPAPLTSPLLFAEKSADGDALFGGGGCKWPLGHPGEADFHFCGEPAFEELPYCEAHALQAYQPADKRRSMRV